jgi:hypothetical protein
MPDSEEGGENELHCSSTSLAPEMEPDDGHATIDKSLNTEDDGERGNANGQK